MSNSPESKNSVTNPGTTPSPAAGAIPTAANPSQPTQAVNPGSTIPAQPTAPATSPVTTGPVPVQSTPAAASQPVAPTTNTNPAAAAASNNASSAQFKTENIGNWAAQQEGYFAEQNRKAEEKRKKSEQTRKKVMPIIFVVGGVIAAALIIWGIVALVIALTSKPEPEIPTIAGGTTEDVNNYRDVLQNFFDQSGDNIGSIEDAVNEALETDNGKEYADQIRLAELIVLQNNEYCTEVLEKANTINVDKLNLDQRISFYSVLYYCNTILGDNQAANEYFRLQYELSLEQGGEGGGA